jgi:hypothetical protein
VEMWDRWTFRYTHIEVVFVIGIELWNCCVSTDRIIDEILVAVVPY